MKTSVFLIALFAAPARASDSGLVAEMTRMMGLFDRGAVQAMPRITPPGRGTIRAERTGPVDGTRWGAVPVPPEGALAERRPGQAQDAFADLEPCAAADAIYIRQPSPEEAARALAPCLDAVSKRYGAAVAVSAGTGGLTLRLPETPAAGTLRQDLFKALELRHGRLFGQPAAIGAAIPAAHGGTSVLQPILDRCAGPKMLPATAEAFVTVYGDCIRQARGLSITSLRADPADPRAVIVYSEARVETLMDISGTVFVPAAPGMGSFRIEARLEYPSLPPADD